MGGEWIFRPWDLVARNGAYIERDFREAKRSGVTNRQLSTLALVGPSNLLRVHETARIDPYTVFDTTNGPIIVAPNVWVQPFTRVEGPCYIGPETQLFRANIRGSVSIGPNCRIGGEVEDTIVHGFSNKYHEGFLGHAYIGEWVNLVRSPPTAICGTITARCLCRCREIRCRPGRPRWAVSSAIIREPGWGRC